MMSTENVGLQSKIEESHTSPVRSSDDVSEATKEHLLLSAYEILRSCTFDEVEFDKVIQAIKDDENKKGSDGVYWVDAMVRSEDLKAAIPAWHVKVLDSFDITTHMRQHLLQSEQLQRPQVLSSDKGTLIIMRVLTPDTSNPKETRFSAALCLKRVLLSFTSVPSTEEPTAPRKQQKVFKNAISYMFEQKLDVPTVSGATAVWMSTHLGRTADASFKLRGRILDLYTKDIDDIYLDTLIDLKDKLLRVSAIAEEQSECVQALAAVSTVYVSFASLKTTLDVLISTAGTTNRALTRLETRLEHLIKHYDSNKQDRINHRLNILTIINAIFLPLTLMAGIWGMNFVNMPELERENGYFFALGAMALLAVILLFVFYRCGWLTM